MSLGERIQKRRNELGLSQAQLAFKIETESNTISRWETNKVRASQKYIVKLAKALQTSTAYLLGETDNPTLSDKIKTVQVNESQNINTAEEAENFNGRLVIRKGDLYINLPETPEGYDALKTFLTGRA